MTLADIPFETSESDSFFLKPNKDLDYINRLFETGKVKPVIDRLYRMDEIQKAFAIFDKGDHKGKIVITM
jgi:NADPH:quinone reductase-like Zn-dependent oxidoreductase